MADVVNLRSARKARARATAAAAADANRAAFGRTKVERDRASADRARTAHDLDGAKLER